MSTKIYFFFIDRTKMKRKLTFESSAQMFLFSLFLGKKKIIKTKTNKQIFIIKLLTDHVLTHTFPLLTTPIEMNGSRCC